MKSSNNEIEIDLLKLLRVLLSKSLVIILIALIAASGAFAYTFFFINPSYDATVSLYVNANALSLGSTSINLSSQLSVSNNLVDTYIYILKSRTTLEDVISKGGFSYNYISLSNMITAKTVTGTAAFDVTVRSSSPTQSEAIANTIAEVLPERISEIVDGTSVRIVDYAIVPAHRSSPSYTMNTIIGALAGAVLAVGIIAVKFLLAEMNDSIIHSADELRELYPDIKILAMIPDMRLSEKKGYYYSSYYGENKKKA